MSNNLDRIILRHAKNDYVVVLKIKGKYTLYLDPGENKPWKGQGVFGKKFGDNIATECERQGVAAKCMTWEDAYNLLLKEYGGEGALEQSLITRILDKQKEMTQPDPKRIPLQ